MSRKVPREKHVSTPATLGTLDNGLRGPRKNQRLVQITALPLSGCALSEKLHNLSEKLLEVTFRRRMPHVYMTQAPCMVGAAVGRGKSGDRGAARGNISFWKSPRGRKLNDSMKICFLLL